MMSTVFVAAAMALSHPIGLLGQSPTTASVSVPRLVSVTGVYQPADGQPPPAGTVVTLLIYAEQQGGAPLWQETQNVELDKSGRYSLLLGAGQADGIPLEVFASGDAQWLALHFAGPGEVEGPRTRITSVPYALRSADADTLGGHPASAYLLAAGGTTGNSTTATTAGQASAHGNEPGAPTAQDVVLPGTVNVLAKYVNAADVGPSAVSEVSGRVGINTGRRFRPTTCTSSSTTRSARLPAWPCRIRPTAPTRPPGCCSMTTTASSPSFKASTTRTMRT